MIFTFYPPLQKKNPAFKVKKDKFVFNLASCESIFNVIQTIKIQLT